MIKENNIIKDKSFDFALKIIEFNKYGLSQMNT